VQEARRRKVGYEGKDHSSFDVPLD